MYDEYERVLNERLDDISKLIEDVCDAVNANADTVGGTVANIPVAGDVASIRDTLRDISEQFGYILSPEQGIIWNADGKEVVEAFTSAALAKAIRENSELGDLNGDGKVTAAEARRILRTSAKLEALSEEETRRADIDRDGKITSREARAILRYSAKLGGLEAVPTKTVDAIRSIDNIVAQIVNDTNLIATATAQIASQGGANVPKFASGGLADFTGLAHLDGSKQHPELVLSAKDTENFIMLRDGLRRVMNGTAFSSGYFNSPLI